MKAQVDCGESSVEVYDGDLWAAPDGSRWFARRDVTDLRLYPSNTHGTSVTLWPRTDLQGWTLVSRDPKVLS